MGSNQTGPFLSVGELGDALGVQSWRIARLFELGLLREPPRVARRRLIPKSMVPTIVDLLRDRGWLPGPTNALPESVSTEATPMQEATA